MRARTDLRPRWMARVAVTLAAGALLSLGGACSSSSSDTATSEDGSAATASTAPSSTSEAPIVPATTDPPGTTRFNLYWLRSCPSADTATEVGDCRLAVGSSRTTTEPDILTAALVALGDGPDDTERDAGLSSNLRPIVELRGVSVEDGVAVVDYNRYFETATTQPQVAQVVFTLTQFPTIDAVRFLVDGAPNGATGTRPTTREDVMALVPPVLVESPALGGVVEPSFAVAGVVSGPELTFTASVVSLDGTTVAEVPGAATADAPPYPFVVRLDAPTTTRGLTALIMTAPDGTQTNIPILVQSP